MVRASGLDVSWTPPREVFFDHAQLGEDHKVDPRLTGEIMSVGWSGKALVSFQKSWRRCWVEGGLGLSAQDAAPANRIWISRT